VIETARRVTGREITFVDAPPKLVADSSLARRQGAGLAAALCGFVYGCGRCLDVGAKVALALCVKKSALARRRLTELI